MSGEKRKTDSESGSFIRYHQAKTNSTTKSSASSRDQLTKFASLVTVREHIPRVVGALSSVSPFLASGILIGAVVAESAGLRTIWDHIATVSAAFSTVSPSLTRSVFVNAVGTGGTTAGLTTTGLTTTSTTSTSGTTTAARDAVCFSVPITFGLGSSAFARNFATFSFLALALTLVIHVTRRFTFGLSRAMSVAFVHQIDDFSIAEC